MDSKINKELQTFCTYNRVISSFIIFVIHYYNIQYQNQVYLKKYFIIKKFCEQHFYFLYFCLNNLLNNVKSL